MPEAKSTTILEKEKLQLSQKGGNNLANFFALLLKVDKRLNPERYKRENDR